MKIVAIAATAAALLLGMATLPGDAPAAKERGARSAGAHHGGARRAAPRAQHRARAHVQRRSHHRARTARPHRRAPAVRSTQRRRAPVARRAGERKSTVARQRARSHRERAHREERASRSRSAERKRDETRQDRRKAEQRRGNANAQNVRSEQRPRAERAAERRRQQEVRSARARLTPEQRRRLRASIDKRRTRIAHARWAHRIGSHVPRRVRLHTFPAAVIGLIPAYAAYRYVVIDDSTYIVDPGSYEIVDIYDEGPAPVYAGGGSRAPAPEVVLTAAERDLVLDSIAPDFPDSDATINLALGAEVAADVELYTFPPILLDEVPKLQAYRFLVVGGRIVIVDPQDRRVLVVLDR